MIFDGFLFGASVCFIVNHSYTFCICIIFQAYSYTSKLKHNESQILCFLSQYTPVQGRKS